MLDASCFMTKKGYRIRIILDVSQSDDMIDKISENLTSLAKDDFDLEIQLT